MYFSFCFLFEFKILSNTNIDKKTTTNLYPIPFRKDNYEYFKLLLKKIKDI